MSGGPFGELGDAEGLVEGRRGVEALGVEVEPQGPGEEGRVLGDGPRGREKGMVQGGGLEGWG